MFAVVTGGGTSGHVMPALAILDLLKESGYQSSDLAYVGSRRGIETRLLNNSDVQSEFLPISGLQRSFSVRSIMRNIAFPFRVLRSRAIALRLVSQWKPSVVVSVGGYASDPMAWAARRKDIPLVCVSYDRIAGLATRQQAKHAAVCAVAFADTDLPNAVVTGAPVRRDVRLLRIAEQRVAARERLGVPPNSLLVTVVGGSLGSAMLNASVPSIMNECAPFGDVFVYHICGERFIETGERISVPAGLAGYICVGYQSAMADVYAATDVLVARAGASTVAEIATAGIASVLVPWSGAADNHQQLNAEWLSSVGGARLVSETECANGTLAKVVAEIVSHRQQREELASAAYARGEVHRGNALVAVIQNAAR